MKRKTLSKIISFYFILTFAFLGGVGSIMNMTNKLIPDLDVLLDNKMVIAPKDNTGDYKIGEQYMNKSDTTFTPPPEVEFYKDPNFYFKSTVGGIVGYILRWILDFVSIGLRALAGKFQ